MDCVAAACGLDAAAVRERNLAALPPPLALPVLGGGPPVHTPEPVSEDGCKNEVRSAGFGTILGLLLTQRMG